MREIVQLGDFTENLGIFNKKKEKRSHVLLNSTIILSRVPPESQTLRISSGDDLHPDDLDLINRLDKYNQVKLSRWKN